MTAAPWAAYQREVLAADGSVDARPFTTDLHALEDAARGRLDPGAFAYVSGSAGAGLTARFNREGLERLRIAPRMLTRANTRHLGTSVMGEAMPTPVLAGPIGVQSIVHPDGELATARACADVGVTMVMSTMSSYSIEDVAAASGDGPRWFQLYWPNDDDVALSILGRARAAGFTVLVVTLDTMSLGWRPPILDLAYLPMLRGTGTAVFLSDPAFRAGLARPPEDDVQAAVARWDEMLGTAARSWGDLAWLREQWHGPIVLKGILRTDDAVRAVDHGMDGVVVSNHGGRQVDGAVAAIDVLPDVVRAVGDRASVLFDSGIRSGADVVKALSLGAEAVLLARPYAYGLGLAGEGGVRHVLRGLLADLDLTLGLAGHHAVAELGPDTLGAPQQPLAATGSAWRP